MTSQEAIKLSFEIKKDPQNYDVSALLYGAVGLIKKYPNAGVAFAVIQLMEAIKEITHGELSPFCQRKMKILESETTEIMCKFLIKCDKAYEYADPIPPFVK